MPHGDTPKPCTKRALSMKLPNLSRLSVVAAPPFNNLVDDEVIARRNSSPVPGQRNCGSDCGSETEDETEPETEADTEAETEADSDAAKAAEFAEAAEAAEAVKAAAAQAQAEAEDLTENCPNGNPTADVPRCEWKAKQKKTKKNFDDGEEVVIDTRKPSERFKRTFANTTTNDEQSTINKDQRTLQVSEDKIFKDAKSLVNENSNYTVKDHNFEAEDKVQETERTYANKKKAYISLIKEFLWYFANNTDYFLNLVESRNSGRVSAWATLARKVESMGNDLVVQHQVNNKSLEKLQELLRSNVLGRQTGKERSKRAKDYLTEFGKWYEDYVLQPIHELSCILLQWEVLPSTI